MVGGCGVNVVGWMLGGGRLDVRWMQGQRAAYERSTKGNVALRCITPCHVAPVMLHSVTLHLTHDVMLASDPKLRLKAHHVLVLGLHNVIAIRAT